jgi:Protein of unknown function (DUF1761)
MEINFLAILLAALSSLVIGFIWYNPKVFGTIWMKESGVTMDENQKPNMFLMFGMSIFYAFMIGFILQMVTIHQFGAFGMIGGKLEEAKPSYTAFMADYGDAYRTFKHGALHGFMTGLFLAFPMTAINAMYEKRSFKYVMISSGYWVVCFMIMGGIICAMK